jgi:hypothetical protein
VWTFVPSTAEACGPSAHRAGSAGGVLTAQRIGSAAGIAITGSVFYSQLDATHRDFATAFRHGVVVIVCFIAAALCLAIADAVTKTSDAQREKHA